MWKWKERANSAGPPMYTVIYVCSMIIIMMIVIIILYNTSWDFSHSLIYGQTLVEEDYSWVKMGKRQKILEKGWDCPRMESIPLFCPYMEFPNTALYQMHGGIFARPMTWRYHLCFLLTISLTGPRVAHERSFWACLWGIKQIRRTSVYACGGPSRWG